MLRLVEQASRVGTPVALWSSTPCTGGSQMQNLNIAQRGVTDGLRAHWKEFKRLFAAFVPLAHAVHSGGGLVAIEWPLRCTYWRDRRVLKLLRHLNASTATLAACMYGLRPQSPHSSTEFIGKAWRLSASDSEFTAALDRRCDGSHKHVSVVGRETAATAFYPPQLAEAVHCALCLWAKRVRSPKRVEAQGCGTAPSVIG